MSCSKVDVWPWRLQRLLHGMSAHHMPIRFSQDVVGEVLVSLKCLPISQRIEVGLLKAKTTSPRSTAENSKVFISVIVATPVFILLPATFTLPTQRDGEVLERKVPYMPIAPQPALLNQTTGLSSLVTVSDRDKVAWKEDRCKRYSPSLLTLPLPMHGLEISWAGVGFCVFRNPQCVSPPCTPSVPP